MLDVLLSPPLAFLLYMLLAGALSLAGRWLAGPAHPNHVKSSVYSSGEAPPNGRAAPGYRPFFIVALFFAVLHLGVLMLGASSPSPVAAAYLVGLMLALVALMLG